MAFAEHERRLLLSMPNVGPRVLERLEEAGIDSLARLSELGVEAAVAAVCANLATPAWANRRRALGRAIGIVAGQQPAMRG